MTNQAAPGPTFINMAQGNAHVEAQIGQLTGNVTTGGGLAAGQTHDIDAYFAAVRAALQQAHRCRDIDDGTLAEAEAELDEAGDLLSVDEPESRQRGIRALQRLRGMVMDFADLGAKVTAIIAVARGIAG